MNRFPLCVNLENKNFLIVGAGKIAMRKFKSISKFTKNIKIVANRIDDALLKEKNLKLVCREFADSDLTDADYVITATGSRFKDEEIVAKCKALNIPVNAADDREECDFFLPGVIKRGSLVVSVSTSGKSPAYSKLLREQIEEIIPDNVEEIIDTLGNMRKCLPSKIQSQELRSRVYKAVLTELLATDDVSKLNIEKIIEEYCDEKTNFSN